MTHASIALALLVPLTAAAPDLDNPVPEVTAERWEKAPPPIPEPRKVTRADYLAYIQRAYKKMSRQILDQAGDPEVRNQGDFARREAFFWQATKDPARAAKAMEFVRGDLAFWTRGPGADKKTGFAMIPPAVETVMWLRDCPALTQADHETCRRWLVTLEKKQAYKEVGAHNRSFGSACGAAAIAHWWPQEPGAGELKRYAEQVWNDWWAFRDTEENAAGYNALWWQFACVWIDATGKDTFRDPGTQALAERWLSYVTPLGVIPKFGDVPGWCRAPGTWIAHWERFATEYKDGRFKWAAHRLFQYMMDHDEEMRQWSPLPVWTADSLMNAYLAADDTIAEQVPQIGHVVTHRKKVRFNDRETRAKTGYYARMTQETVPDKLILRTGFAPADTYLMMQLCPMMGHGHADTGTINGMVSQGSVLLGDPSKHVHGHEHHNSFVVLPDKQEPVRWGALLLKLQDMKVTVDRFHTAGEVAYGDVRIEKFMDQPVTVRRRVFFLGEAGTWVRDTVEATEPHAATIGPAWQSTAVYGQRGDHWVNTCMVTLPVADIGKTGRVRYLLQWQNRPHDLLVYFVPQPGAEMAVDDVTMDDTQWTRWTFKGGRLNNLTRRAWYRRHVELQPGKPQTFDSVLVPHPPTPDAGPLASGIAMVVNTPEAAVLKLQAGRRTTWLGVNDTGRALRVGDDLLTDAEVFQVVTEGDTVTRYWLVNARTLTVGGKELHASSERQTVQGPAGG